jgi:hypothetical protein
LGCKAIIMRPPIALLGELLQCGALVSAALASTPAQRGGASSGGGYSRSASPCGAASSITDEHTTCADAAAALGYPLRFHGPEWASGCLFHDGDVYFSPIADGSTDKVGPLVLDRRPPLTIRERENLHHPSPVATSSLLDFAQKLPRG